MMSNKLNNITKAISFLAVCATSISLAHPITDEHSKLLQEQLFPVASRMERMVQDLSAPAGGTPEYRQEVIDLIEQNLTEANSRKILARLAEAASAQTSSRIAQDMAHGVQDQQVAIAMRANIEHRRTRVLTIANAMLLAFFPLCYRMVASEQSGTSYFADNLPVVGVFGICMAYLVVGDWPLSLLTNLRDFAYGLQQARVALQEANKYKDPMQYV